MASRFEALRDDYVTSVIFEPYSLPYTRGGCKNPDASRLQPVDQPRGGKAEMEANRLRKYLFDGFAHFVIEQQAQTRFWHCIDVEPEALVVWSQELPPTFLRDGVGWLHRVTKEIEVERPRHMLPNLPGSVSYLTRPQQRAGQ